MSPFSIGHTPSIRVHFPTSYVSLPECRLWKKNMSSHILELPLASLQTRRELVWCWWRFTSYIISSWRFFFSNPPERYWSGWRQGQEHRSIWGFPKMVGFPNKPMGFPTKNDHFEVLWGYHHLRKHPYRSSHWVQVCILYLLDGFFSPTHLKKYAQVELDLGSWNPKDWVEHKKHIWNFTT